MAINEYAELDGVTVGSTELSILSGTTSLQSRTDQGMYGLWLDIPAASLAKGDRFAWRVKEKVRASGDTQYSVMWGRFRDDQWDEPLVVPPLMLRNGWDMTLIKEVGTDRAFDASVRGVSCTISQPYELNAVTVGATELSIVSGTTSLQTITDDGLYQLWVDPVTNMAVGDKFVIRIYEKVEGTGGTKRQFYETEYHHDIDIIFVSPVFCLINGWDMTIQKVSGTDRAFSASIRKVA